MLAIERDRAVAVCRTLLPTGRAENLLEKWSKAYAKQSEEVNAILVIATVIAAGDQEPSATTALSAAQGLVGKQAGRMVLLVGLAFEALENTDAISSSIQELIAEGLANTFERFSTKLSN